VHIYAYARHGCGGGQALGQRGAGGDGAAGVRQVSAAAVLQRDKPRVRAVQSAQEPLLPREDDEEQSVRGADAAAGGGGGRRGVSLLPHLLVMSSTTTLRMQPLVHMRTVTMVKDVVIITRVLIIWLLASTIFLLDFLVSINI